MFNILNKKIVDQINFIEINELKVDNNNILFEKIKNNKNVGIKIKRLETIKILTRLSIFKFINNFLLDYDLIDNEEVFTLFFVGKKITVDIKNNESCIQKILLNPIISNIYNLPNNINMEKFKYKIQHDYEIENNIGYINVNEILLILEQSFSNDFLINNLTKIWGYFISYYIYNLPSNLSNDKINYIYENTAKSLGTLVQCRPVNDSSKKISYFRDVKFIPNTNHFYSSNITQPLHNDFAYFTYEKAPNYLSLYCLEPSDYGGITSLISTKKIKNILETYNKELLSKLEIDITFKSQVDSKGNFDIHNKKLFDLKTNFINWNYFQTKEEFNDSSKIEIRNELFDFLNNVITKGNMHDLNIKWSKGDCIIFNDHLNLHTRSSFLGNRWLSGHAFFKK